MPEEVSILGALCVEIQRLEDAATWYQNLTEVVIAMGREDAAIEINHAIGSVHAAHDYLTAALLNLKGKHQ